MYNLLKTIPYHVLGKSVARVRANRYRRMHIYLTGQVDKSFSLQSCRITCNARSTPSINQEDSRETTHIYNTKNMSCVSRVLTANSQNQYKTLLRTSHVAIICRTRIRTLSPFLMLEFENSCIFAENGSSPTSCSERFFSRKLYFLHF